MTRSRELFLEPPAQSGSVRLTATQLRARNEFLALHARFQIVLRRRKSTARFRRSVPPLAAFRRAPVWQGYRGLVPRVFPPGRYGWLQARGLKESRERQRNRAALAPEPNSAARRRACYLDSHHQGWGALLLDRQWRSALVLGRSRYVRPSDRVRGSTPIQVSGLGTIVDASASLWETCVVQADHVVKCWGSAVGQSDWSASPVTITGLPQN